MSELDEVVKIDLNFAVQTYHLFDKLFEVGVTQITEKWHDPLTIELILEGQFLDEDIIWTFYQHSPAMYTHVGSTTMTIETSHLTYTAGFTRGD